jgi:hypothetical protein
VADRPGRSNARYVNAAELQALGELVKTYSPNPQLAALGYDYGAVQSPAKPRLVLLQRILDAAQAQMREPEPPPAFVQSLGIRG